jgi:hypothetical protein
MVQSQGCVPEAHTSAEAETRRCNRGWAIYGDLFPVVAGSRFELTISGYENVQKYQVR